MTLTVLNALKDALRTLLQPSWDARLVSLEAQARAAAAEARAVTTELNDALEKLNTWSAREAKRRARESRVALEEAPAEQQAVAAVNATLVAPPGSSEWKAAMRRQLMAGRRVAPVEPAEIAEDIA